MSSFQTKLFINGEYVDPVKGGTFKTINPANGQVIAEVAAATSEDIDRAVQAATACMHSDHWGYKVTGAACAAILRKLGAILERRIDELAHLDSLDMGKPLREALADMGDAISGCAHFAALAEQRDSHQDEVIENGTGGDFITKIRLEPIGVIGAITPWNYPLLMAIWKVLPCIATGCTMVLKPSELAPLSCNLLGEMCNEAGLPPGALNVVNGLGPVAGGPLSNHPMIDKVSFTGSVPTAQKIMMAAAMGPRAVSMELGGKSPLVVFADADVPACVDWILTGFLWGSGQVCSATSRVLVHPAIREELISALLQRIKGIAIGDSCSEAMKAVQGPTMGPVVNESQYKKILGYLKAAKEQGLVFACGDETDQATLKAPGSGTEDGYFIKPVVLLDVPVTSAVWREEIFGPVLCIRDFSPGASDAESEANALHDANATEFGLAAAVFSADPARCERVARGLRAGIVWKNCCQPAFIQAPWGGVKKSGFGRELGRWGMEEFSSVKQVTSCEPGFQWGLW